MSQYQHEVFRWPFSVSGANRDFIVRNTTSGTDNTQTIAAGIYICDGSGAVVSPIDLIKRLQTAIAAALAALSVSGTITVTLRTDGRVSFLASGLDKDIALKNLTADQIQYLGVGATQITGGLFAIGTTAGGEIVTAYQAGAQWHPMMDSQRDTGDVHAQIVTAGLNLRGQERRVARSAAQWSKRKIGWQFLPAAVMSDYRADDAAYASYAGWTAGEDNTWENMLRYLLSVYSGNPYNDNRVYLYRYNDPATAVREGPYDVILSESRPDQNGINYDDYVADMGTEHYPCHIVLRSQS
jgi:hypothetical protein